MFMKLIYDNLYIEHYKPQMAKTSKPLRFLSLGGWWLRLLSFGHQSELLVQLS